MDFELINDNIAMEGGAGCSFTEEVCQGNMAYMLCGTGYQSEYQKDQNVSNYQQVLQQVDQQQEYSDWASCDTSDFYTVDKTDNDENPVSCSLSSCSESDGNKITPDSDKKSEISTRSKSKFKGKHAFKGNKPKYSELIKQYIKTNNIQSMKEFGKKLIRKLKDKHNIKTHQVKR